MNTNEAEPERISLQRGRCYREKRMLVRNNLPEDRE